MAAADGDVRQTAIIKKHICRGHMLQRHADRREGGERRQIPGEGEAEITEKRRRVKLSLETQHRRRREGATVTVRGGRVH